MVCFRCSLFRQKMNVFPSMKVLQTQEEFETLLDQCASQNCLLLLDFYADWCGPCRTVAPQFYKLAEEFHARHVICAKVNADHARDLCVREFVSALPTFKLYRNRECVHTVVGKLFTILCTTLNIVALNLQVHELISSVLCLINKLWIRQLYRSCSLTINRDKTVGRQQKYCLGFFVMSFSRIVCTARVDV